MTKRDYKKKLKDYLKENKTDLKTCLENSRFSLDSNLVEAISNVFGLELIETNLQDDSYIEVQGYVTQLHRYLVLNTGLPLSFMDEKDLIDELYKLKNELDELENKIIV